MKPRQKSTEPCRHFRAERTGTTEARRIPRGWQYSTSYHCPDCGAHFIETHTSQLEED